jgi:hypothetical protein
MAKTNSAFKFGKMNKIQLGNIDNPDARAIYRRAMVDAQASYMASKNRKYTELKSTPQGQTPKASS